VFKIGQKVVCITARWEINYDEICPVKGEVYTIREFMQDQQILGIRVKEIVNLPHHYTDIGFQECGFNVVNFRPLQDRPTQTSIQVFKDILAGVPIKEDA